MSVRPDVGWRLELHMHAAGSPAVSGQAVAAAAGPGGCEGGAAAGGPLERAMDRGQVSARGADRIIRMSWTLADLAGQPRPRLDEIGSALGLWLETGL